MLLSLQRSRRARHRLRRRAGAAPRRASSARIERARRPRRRSACTRQSADEHAAGDRAAELAGQAPLITLVVLCVVTALLTDRFLSPLNLTNILVQSSIMAVIAMGMTFVIVGGGFDLSVGSTVALAGCIAAMVMLKFGIVAGVVAGIAAGVAVGLANGARHRDARVNPFITTLGTMVLVRGVVYLITGGAPVSGEDGLPGAFVAFGIGALFGIHYLVWVPALAARRSVVADVCDALRPARLRDRRQPGSGLSVRRAGRPDHRLDLRLVRRARRRRRRDAGGSAAVRPADRRRVLRTHRHRRRRARRRLAAGRRRHALQERHRRLHHDRARQRPQPSQRRFLLAAGRGRGGHHCRRRGRSATLAR